jgi:hypothetical protein
LTEYLRHLGFEDSPTHSKANKAKQQQNLQQADCFPPGNGFICFKVNFSHSRAFCLNALKEL